MKQTIALLAVLLLAPAGSVAAANGAKTHPQVYLHVSTDHADASYAIGEAVTWQIKLTGIKAHEPAPTPTYTVTSGKTELANGALTIVDGTAKVTCKSDRPGILVLKVVGTGLCDTIGRKEHDETSVVDPVASIVAISARAAETVRSPDGKVVVTVELKEGLPLWSVAHRARRIGPAHRDRVAAALVLHADATENPTWPIVSLPAG